MEIAETEYILVNLDPNARQNRRNFTTFYQFLLYTITKEYNQNIIN